MAAAVPYTEHDMGQEPSNRSGPPIFGNGAPYVSGQLTKYQKTTEGQKRTRNQVFLNSLNSLNENSIRIIKNKFCREYIEPDETELDVTNMVRLVIPSLKISVQLWTIDGQPVGSLADIGKKIELAGVVSSLVRKDNYERKSLTLDDIVENPDHPEQELYKLPDLLLKAFGDFAFEKMFLHTGLKCQNPLKKPYLTKYFNTSPKNINEIKLMVNNVEQYLIQYLKKNDEAN